MTSKKTIRTKYRTSKQCKITINLRRLIVNKMVFSLMNFIKFSYKNSVVVKKAHDNEKEALCL